MTCFNLKADSDSVLMRDEESKGGSRRLGLLVTQDGAEGGSQETRGLFPNKLDFVCGGGGEGGRLERGKNTVWSAHCDSVG